MVSERWERAKRIAAAASEQDTASRESFVRNAAGGDPELESTALAILRGFHTPDTELISTAPPLGQLASGTLLKARYLIIREISRGGFGIVYLAHDQQLHGKPVVIKIQLDTLGDDPWFERKFGEEIRALALIDHPGVVGALDSGKTPDGRPFLVMQYVQGRSLRSVMSPEGMPLDRVANIVRQTGQALGAAHDKRVWHRDLKPENIMLQVLPGGEEHVRLIDFGIATIADLQLSQQRVATRVAGSLGYMAPEQVYGQPSSGTDVYAFGVIAYEMITGRKPFLPEDAVQLAALQRAGVRIKPSDLRPGLSSRAQRLILQALSYNPKDRPSGAPAFGDQLAQALLAGPGASTSGAHAVVPRKRHTITALLAALVAVALIVAVWLFRWGSPTRSEAIMKSGPAELKSPAVSEGHGQGNLAVELEFWNSVKNENRPSLYREYLTKYPHGQFATVAQIKLDELTRATGEAPNNSRKAKPSGSGAPILPQPRTGVNAEEYNGPLRGELQWAGQLPEHGMLTIQGGGASAGRLSGDLPRLPVIVEAPPGISITSAPSDQNHWDRMVLRNDEGKNINGMIIRWKLGK